VNNELEGTIEGYYYSVFLKGLTKTLNVLRQYNPPAGGESNLSSRGLWQIPTDTQWRSRRILAINGGEFC
jgi:hypothetical protein